MKNLPKLVVITGGTKGIGRAVVEKFASEGYTVATCARSEEDLIALSDYISSTYANPLHTLATDLSKKEEVTNFVEFIRLIGRPVDVLVNNVGVYFPGEVLKEKDGMLEKMISTNLYSAYYVTRGLASLVIQSKRGHIFNICSVASLGAYPNGGSYSISKFALYGFSQAVREEMKEVGVRVTSVIPGAVYTSSWDGIDLPKDRLMESKDISESIYSAYNLSKTSVVEEIILRPQLGDL